MALWWGNSPQIVKLRGPKLHNSSSSDFPNTWANHRKNLSWPHTHTNPNCTLCQMNDKDTWPHLLSLCNNKFLKSLRIARHNVDAHQVTNLLKSNLCTRHLTLINAGNQHGSHQKNTITPWILSCTRNTTRCECLAKLRPDLVYIQWRCIWTKWSTNTHTGPNHPNHSIHLYAWEISWPIHTNKRNQIQPVRRCNKSTRLEY